jgi:DNA-binding MarR family transcriptional regulator
MGKQDPTTPQRLVVSPAQLKLMSFGPRREIIAALANDPDLSARELAGRLRRPVTGLYRHLDRLLEAGLIRETGRRPSSKRPETLYALTFSTFSAIEATETSEGRAAFSQAASRYAAATARKLRRSLENGSARLYADDANAGFGVLDLQLDKAGLVEFHRLRTEFLVRARKLRVRDRAGVETISVAVLFAPAE